MRRLLIRFIQLIMITCAIFLFYKAYNVVNLHRQAVGVIEGIPKMTRQEINAYVHEPKLVANEYSSDPSNITQQISQSQSIDPIIEVEDPFSRNQLETLLANINIDDLKYPADLTIPKINLAEKVFIGTDASVLSLGLGLMNGTDIPSSKKGTSSVIAGHRGYFGIGDLFLHLDKLEIGDLVIVNRSDQKLVYQVIDTAIVKPDHVEAIPTNKDHSYLTLVTCTPKYVWSDRLLVYTQLIKVINE